MNSRLITPQSRMSITYFISLMVKKVWLFVTHLWVYCPWYKMSDSNRYSTSQMWCVTITLHPVYMCVLVLTVRLAHPIFEISSYWARTAHGGQWGTRTLNHAVNSRGLYHWANCPYSSDITRYKLPLTSLFIYLLLCQPQATYQNFKSPMVYNAFLPVVV